MRKDILPNAPGTNPNSFELAYTYHLNGSLKTLTDPYGESFNYAYDEAGRLNAVTGSTYAGMTEYAENAQISGVGWLEIS